jgi:hypothetical protein
LLRSIRHRGRETTLHYNKTATRRAPLVGRHPAPGIMHSQRHNWIDDGFTSLPQFGSFTAAFRQKHREMLKLDTP